MNAIEIKNLNFGYTKDKQILKDINISIPYNKFICIVGHNGSGKSTLSKLLSGLITADSGTIHICNILMNAGNTKSILNKLGLVFQNPDNQFIGITPEDDIAFGLENKKVPAKVIKEIITEITDFLNLKSILKVNSSMLSGGQKQKVAIASVLANNPEIFIFDESTALLDEASRTEIQKIMVNLVHQEQKTIISITHDMEELLFADQVIVMRDGQVVANDTAENILKDSKLLYECNLHAPFIFDLKEKLKTKDIELDHFTNQEELLNRISSKVPFII